jgi:DNA-binding NtrC family response regulator
MPGEHESRLVSGARQLVGHEVLVVDRDDAMRQTMMRLLAPEGLHVTGATAPDKALELVAAKFYGVVVVDLDTPAPGGGLELVGKIHTRSPQSTVLLLTPRPSFEAAVEAFRLGARDVIVKAPEQLEQLKRRVVEGAVAVLRSGGTSTLLADVRAALDDFLKVLMAAERRAQDAEARLAGKDPAETEADVEVAILCVDGDDRLYKGMKGLGLPGYGFVYAQSGGEALDRIGNYRFQIALVGQSIPDLPGDMVIRALKSQAPELIVISYVPNGPMAIVESTRTIPLVDQFTTAAQLTERLAELSQAYRERHRERRYLQAFRERHFEFLRRFAELKKRLEQAG